MRIDTRQVKKLIKLAKSEGLKHFSLVNGTFSCTFELLPVEAKEAPKVKKLTKEEKETLQKVEEQAKIDEMMLTDPLAYEEHVALGQLQDVEEENANS